MPDTPSGAAPKVKPRTALIIVGLVAAGGYLWLRSHGTKPGTGNPAAPAAGGTASTTYGLGPAWVRTVVTDLHSPPRKRHRRSNRKAG